MIPVRLNRAWREIARIAAQYTAAVIRESDGKPGRLLPSLYKVLLARLCYDVGPRYYSLFEFAGIPQSVWGNFVTDDPSFKKLLEEMSPSHAREIANDKALFYRHCIEHGLPTLPILCLVSKHPAPQYPNVQCAMNLGQWRTAMARAPDELFAKPIHGTFGEGAFTMSRVGERVHFADREGSLDDVFGYLQDMVEHERGWLIQPRLRRHSAIAGIMAPRGVGTIRVVTCMDSGRARLLLAVMKITVGNNVTDNFHSGSTGNLVAPIDLGTGVLAAARGSTRKDWPAMTAISHHPDTGHAIEGFVIPNWTEIVALALKSQQSLPLLKSTGWDIALTPQGPVLVETNAFYSVDILQVAHRRGLKRELMQELGVGAAGAS
jgi:hypothetical protein